jgi:hypothetical protein
VTADDLHKSATLLRTLASAEHARLADNAVELHRLMDPVDPIECMALAACLDSAAAIRKAGLTSVPERAMVRHQPPVVHAGDNWSRKAPCA